LPWTCTEPSMTCKRRAIIWHRLTLRRVPARHWHANIGLRLSWLFRINERVDVSFGAKPCVPPHPRWPIPLGFGDAHGCITLASRVGAPS
jgi:hypothetical protein